MMPPILDDLARAKQWRRLFVQYLRLSVATCLFAAILNLWVGEGEDAKLLASGFFAFAMIGVAFVRALPKLKEPVWWHWVLGTALIMPGVLYTWFVAQS